MNSLNAPRPLGGVKYLIRGVNFSHPRYGEDRLSTVMGPTKVDRRVLGKLASHSPRTEMITHKYNVQNRDHYSEFDGLELGVENSSSSKDRGMVPASHLGNISRGVKRK